MALRGPFTELMALSTPQIYSKYVSLSSNVQPILYVKLLKTLYGYLKSTLLFYRKLWGDLHSLGYKINPYNPCGTNKTIHGSQMTVT
jgi:hypothetical protein